MFTNSYCHFTHQERLNSDEKWRVEFVDGIRVVWMRTIHYKSNGFDRGLNMISNVWRSIAVAKEIHPKPDVIIGPSVPLLTGWAALAIAKIKRATFIFEVRDIWPVTLVDNGAMSPRSPVYFAFALVEKYLYRKAKAISSVLPMTFKRVAECGVDPKKVVWIPNGADLDKFFSLMPYKGGGQGLVTIMYIGGYSNMHDVITIVRAVGILKRKGVNRFRVILVGDGEKKVECENEAFRLKLDNIEFRPSQPKALLPQLQLEADILVACVTDTPIYRYGLNLNKLVDYLSSGRPVVFAGNAPNDPVSTSGAGCTVAPENPEAMADALYMFIEMSPFERVEFGRRGVEYAKREFDIRKLGERMESLLQNAISD